MDSLLGDRTVKMPGEGRSALSDEVIATFFGVGAAGAGVGSGSTSVLRFLVAGTAIVSPYITAPDSAVDGTLITIRTPGSYRAEFMLPQVASTSLLLGISIGFATTGNLTLNPAMGTNGVIATEGPHTLAAATASGRYLGVDFNVPDDESGGTRAILRFLATDNANATPIPSITAAGVWARVKRQCDLAA